MVIKAAVAMASIADGMFLHRSRAKLLKYQGIEMKLVEA